MLSLDRFLLHYYLLKNCLKVGVARMSSFSCNAWAQDRVNYLSVIF